MSSPALLNGTQSESIARAARLSRYARHLLSANPALAAEAAARREEFTPATRDGRALPFTLTFTYRFRLSE